ncbi:hypothetical protein PSH25_001088 [Micromonospora sp. PSH25]|nr:hypothetical protein [Micromonospora foliorum]
MNVDKSPAVREYAGLIWIDDKPATRLRILARSLDEAESHVIEEYGEGHIISIWNEKDATSAR